MRQLLGYAMALVLASCGMSTPLPAVAGSRTIGNSNPASNATEVVCVDPVTGAPGSCGSGGGGSGTSTSTANAAAPTLTEGTTYPTNFTDLFGGSRTVLQGPTGVIFDPAVFGGGNDLYSGSGPGTISGYLRYLSTTQTPSNVQGLSADNADGQASSTTDVLAAVRMFAYNGSTWDRLRSDSAHFLVVDPQCVSLTTPPVLTNGQTTQGQCDPSGNFKVVSANLFELDATAQSTLSAAGAAPSKATGVQGVTGGTPLQVSGPADNTVFGTLSAAGAVTLTGLNGQSSIGLQLGGTFTALAGVMEYSRDNFATVKAASYLSPTGIVSTVPPAAGFYRYLGVSGYPQVRFRVTSLGSGSVAIVLTTSTGVDATVVASAIPQNFQVTTNGDAGMPIHQGSAPNANSASVYDSSTNNLFYTGTTTALGASATYTGATRDVGVTAGTGQPYAYFNGVFITDQGATAYIDGSNDGSTFFTVATSAVVGGTPLILTVPVLFRYHRTRLVNGSTAETTLVVNAAYTAS